MASTSGSLELGVVTEVELNLNHQNYFTLGIGSRILDPGIVEIGAQR